MDTSRPRSQGGRFKSQVGQTLLPQEFPDAKRLSPMGFRWDFVIFLLPETMVFTCFYRQMYGFAVIFVPIIQFYEWVLRSFSKYGKAMRKNRKI